MDNRKIVVYHNKIVINNYKQNDIPELEKMFDLWDKAYFRFKTIGSVYNRQEKTYTIPRGIDIKKVERLVGSYAFYDNKYNKPVTNSNQILIKFPPKDEKQELALKFLSGKGEYSYTKKYNQLFLALNTGAGKTYLGIVYSALLNVKTVIITNSVGWLNQWKDSYLYHTNVISSEILFISGSKMIDKILSQRFNQDKYKVYMVTHDTLLSYASNNSIDDLFRLWGLDLRL